MNHIRIFRHIDCEGPAYLQTLLDESAIPSKLVRIDQGESVPAQLDDVAGLIFVPMEYIKLTKEFGVYSKFAPA